MAWSWEGAVGGGATGAGAGSAFGPWGTAVGGAAGFVLGGALGGGGGDGGYSADTYVADPEAAAIGGSQEWTETAPMPSLSDAQMIAWIYSGQADMYLGKDRVEQFKNEFETSLGIDEATIAQSVQSIGPSGDMIAQEQGYDSYADFYMAQREAMIQQLATPEGAEDIMNRSAASGFADEEKMSIRGELNAMRYDLPAEVVVDSGTYTGAEARGDELQQLSDSLLTGGPVSEFDMAGIEDQAQSAEEALGDYGYVRSGLLGSADTLYNTGASLEAQGARSREAYNAQLARTQGMTADVTGRYAGHIGDLEGVIAGTAPSVAVLERERAMQDAQRQALSLAATSRNPGAWRDAIVAGQEAANKAAQDSSILRAQEIQAALGMRGEALSGMSGAYGSMGGLEADILSTGTEAERAAFEAAGGLYGDRADVYGQLGDVTMDQYAANEQLVRDRIAAEQARSGTELAEFEARTDAAAQAEAQASDYLINQARLNVDVQGINAGAQASSTGAEASAYGTDARLNYEREEGARDRLYGGLSAASAELAKTDPFDTRKRDEEEEDQ